MSGLFAELKRRNVIRMAGLYLVGAWLVTQVAATVLPMFDAPAWLPRSIVILLAIGFLPALVVSWLFELTPEGWKRDSEVTPEQATASGVGRRMDRLILAGALAVTALLLVDRFWFASRSAPAAAAPATADAAPVPSEASIAVLPFLNLSTDAENGFFADGISEEVLNVLAGIEGLTVASRTSAFTFKGKDTPIPEIARQLGVHHVLEGSVRKQGNRVRITAQLIKAGTDAHLWSETYDRDLTDIFKIQQEIAQSISIQLEGMLGKRQVAVNASTSSLGGYERFLRGRARFQQRREFTEAIEDLRYAVEQDPQFAEAWITLAAAQLAASGYGASGLTRADTVSAVHAALDRAEALAPDHPMVHGLHGQLRIWAGDMVGGIERLERAARASKQDSTPVVWLGQVLHLTGYTDEAIAMLERAERMEPLVGINIGSLTPALLAGGQRERAEAKSVLAAARGWHTARMLYLWELAASGESARAVEMAESDRASQAPGERISQALFDAVVTGLRDPTRFHVDGYPAPAVPGATPKYLVELEPGHDVLDWLQTTVRDPTRWESVIAAFRTLWFPSARALRIDPRFFAVADAVGFVRLWETRGYPPGCKRVAASGGDHLDCTEMRR